jgi:hypothetical protein
MEDKLTRHTSIRLGLLQAGIENRDGITSIHSRAVKKKGTPCGIKF